MRTAVALRAARTAVAVTTGCGSGIGRLQGTDRAAARRMNTQTEGVS